MSVLDRIQVFRGIETGGDSGGDVAEAKTPTADTTPETSDTSGEQPKETEFILPNEYKDKSWAEKIKSQDDLYKQIDNLSSIAGKKHVYPSADATPEEITKYYEGLKPESKDVYNFGEDHPNPEVASKFGDMLYNANISKHQAQPLIEAYQAFEKEALEQATSEQGFNQEMTDRFGKDYDKVVSGVSNVLKANVSEDTQKIIDSMPNQYLGAVYEAINSLKDAYGANEGTDKIHGEGGNPPSTPDINKVRADLRNKIAVIETRPHTADEKQELINKLNETYK
jgi:hypothetical protein